MTAERHGVRSDRTEVVHLSEPNEANPVTRRRCRTSPGSRPGSVRSTIHGRPTHRDGTGNLALTLGARGGIYIGAIVPKLGTTFAESGFRARFKAKGRLRDYLAAIPTYAIVRPLSALVGAAALLERASER
jgi:Glucokinase